MIQSRKGLRVSEGRLLLNSNAPGQLLGYALQFPRALYYAKAGPGDLFSIVLLGDGGMPGSWLLKALIIWIQITRQSRLGTLLPMQVNSLMENFSDWIKALKEGSQLLLKKHNIISILIIQEEKELFDSFVFGQYRRKKQRIQ